MTNAPYRSTEVRPDTSPLRRSWWALVTSALLTVGFAGYAYVVFRYVADGWLGYVVGALACVVAVIYANEIGRGKLGACPRCGQGVETHSANHGYLSSSCDTFLETDRNQLLASPRNRVAEQPCFGVRADGPLVLPDRCCVCGAATTQQVKVEHAGAQIDVPHCAAHSGGAAASSGSRELKFQSLAYATDVRDASHGQFVGIVPLPASAKERRDERILFLTGAALSGGLAAATYYGLAAFERTGYIIVPTSLKGVLLWLAIELVGRVLLTAILVAFAGICAAMLIGTFKPATATRPSP